MFLNKRILHLVNELESSRKSSKQMTGEYEELKSQILLLRAQKAQLGTLLLR